MEYGWDMNGIGMGSAWNMHGKGLEYVWEMYGICRGTGWNELCLENVWNMCGGMYGICTENV